MGTKVILRSRRPHSLNVPYGGETMVIPPHGTTKPVEEAKLGRLSAGIDIIRRIDSPSDLK